jgi:hypothetical protein
MRNQHPLAITIFAIALAGAWSSASAGEVKGPPGSTQTTNYTGAREHANSECAYSGLNDYDPESGQNVNIVQTVADAWKLYGLPKGFPGTSGACHGGTNPNRGDDKE